LEIAAAIPTFPQPRLTTAMEKWKSNGRIPTFPRLITLSKKSKPKGDQSRPANLVFRLISGLENAEMTDPAAKESEVQRWNSKLLQEKRPKVHYDGGPNADETSAKNEFRCATHVLTPFFPL